MDVGNVISGLAFSKFSLNIWKFWVHILLKCSLRILSLAWRIFRHTLLFYDCFNHTSGQKSHVNVITSQYQILSSKSSESVIDETQKKIIYCIKLETKLTACYGDETSTV